jgi:hypothetical protein
MRPALRWLALGAAAGIFLAAASLLRGGEAQTAKPPAGDAVAWVDGRPVSRETLARFAAAVARERGVLEFDPATQRQLLERLIDEELLLQRGLALDLARREPAARRAIVSAVIDGLTAEDDDRPERAALEAFYRENRREWTRSGPMRVEAVLVPIAETGGSEAEARERALEAARRARAGESMAALALAHGNRPSLPPGPLEVEALRERLGGAAVEALLGLEPGQTSEPVRGADGWWVLRLVAREPGAALPLEQVLEPVRARYQQRRHDERLREALAAMRAGADVRIADPELAAATDAAPGE